MWAEVWREGRTSCPLSVDSGHVTLLVHQYVHQPSGSRELWCSEFLLQVHCESMIDYITGHVIELSL